MECGLGVWRTLQESNRRRDPCLVKMLLELPDWSTDASRDSVQSRWDAILLEQLHTNRSIAFKMPYVQYNNVSHCSVLCVYFCWEGCGLSASKT